MAGIEADGDGGEPAGAEGPGEYGAAGERAGELFTTAADGAEQIAGVRGSQREKAERADEEEEVRVEF